MKWRLPDRALAAIFGALLLSGACWAVFGFQHGFEEQIGWYITLLPGALAAAAISGPIYKRSDATGYVVFWCTLGLANFIWYFAISYVGIKLCRLVSKVARRA